MGSSAWEGRKDEGWGSMRLTWRGQEWNKQKESNEWVRWWKGGREIKHLQNERRAGGLKRSLGTAVRSSGRPSSSSGGIWLLSPLINVSDLCPSRNSNLPSGLHKPLSPQTCLSWLRRFQVAGDSSGLDENHLHTWCVFPLLCPVLSTERVILIERWLLRYFWKWFTLESIFSIVQDSDNGALLGFVFQ